MPESGEYIGKFRIIRLLGEGGMGSVYLAQDQRVKPPRMVAIKMLRDNNEEVRERFGREVGIIANFEHPNIVHVFEVDEHDGHPFMAMAYVKGETLLEVIRRKAPMPILRKIEIIEHLCAGLAYAHRQGVIHRDIKPGNIMVDAEETLKILDFGIARLADSTLTVSGSIIGTPNYMSPEQVAGQPLGPPSDIFAVGAMMFELLTYKQAFPGRVPEVLGRIQYAEPDPLETIVPGLDPGVQEILDRSLKKNPAERYQDLGDMQRDLARVRKRLEARQDDRTLVDPPKRTGQIETFLALARAAYAAGDFAAVRARAAEVLEIDGQNTDAIDLDRTAHRRLVEQQNREWLTKAQHLLAADNLAGAGDLVEQVLRLVPNEPEALRLRSEIGQRRQRVEEDVTQKRAVERALARARTQIAEGAFEAAVRSLDEVFALVPDHADARALLEKAKGGVGDRDQPAQDAQATGHDTRPVDDGRTQHLPGNVHDAHEARRLEIVACVEAGLKAVAAGRLDHAGVELAAIERIQPGAPEAARLSKAIDDELESVAKRRRLETIRLDVQAALKARDAELAEQLTHELAQQGADSLEVAQLRTHITTVRYQQTLVQPRPEPRAQEIPTPAPVERKAMSEAMRVERAGLRAFYRAEYERAIEAFERIPQNATGDLSPDRILFYLACCNAALALLEGAKGKPRLEKAKDLFRKAEPDKNPFAVDRKYVSPGIIRALET